MAIKNIFKARIKPRAAKFKQNQDTELNIAKIPAQKPIVKLVNKSPNLPNQPDLETQSPKTPPFQPKQALRKLIAKLPNFKQNQPTKPDLETEIAKVDRSLIPGANHQKIVAIFRRMAENVKPENIEKIAENLPKMKRGALKQIWTQVQSLLTTIRDPNVAWKSKTLAIAALIYLISPFDAIPDVIPGLGLTDDVALIVAVVSSLTAELSKYVEQSADKGVKIAAELADIQVKKYNKIVRLGLIGSILAGIIAILVQFISKHIS